MKVRVDRDILDDWKNPLGFMDGGYASVTFMFPDGVTGEIRPFMTLEGDDYFSLQLYKDGKVVAKSFPDDVWKPTVIQYNGKEYCVQLE